MEPIANLLFLYASLVFVNLLASALLWKASKHALHAQLFRLWLATVVAAIIQGALRSTELGVIIGFGSVGFINLVLAYLIEDIQGRKPKLGWTLGVLAAACSTAFGLHRMGASFTISALPVSIAVAIPLVVAAAQLLRHWKELTAVLRGLTVVAVSFVAHNLDFAFLGNRPELAAVGFTLAIVIIFALSILAPLAVLEKITTLQLEALRNLAVTSERLERETIETQRFRDQAFRDPLTGIANRRACDRELAEALAAGDGMALALIDIDHFKQVNDVYGHPAGDAVLKQVAAAMASIARDGDLVARFGGEEFAVIARSARPDALHQIGERFRKCIEALEIPELGERKRVTASVGVAFWNRAARDGSVESLIERADQALYQAKHGGRNQVVVDLSFRPLSKRPSNMPINFSDDSSGR